MRRRDEPERPAPEVRRGPGDPAAMIRSRIEIGDTILTGGVDPISRIIQTGSRSPFSHVVVVSGEGSVTEAYDHALTPAEDDDGIFEISVEELVARSGLRRMRIIRPRRVDEQRIRDVACHFRQHSPGFPTVGMVGLALCGVSGPVLRASPRRLRNRWMAKQIRLAGDGIQRMHCAETVTRIYLAAGVPLRFRSPRLRLHIEFFDHLEQLHRLDRFARLPEPASIPTVRRTAAVGVWPSDRGVCGYPALVTFALGAGWTTWRQRSRSQGPMDPVDLVLPGDFARAEPFEVVSDLEWTRRGWREAPVLIPRGPELPVPVSAEAAA